MYNIFRKLQDYLRFREAVRKADDANSVSGHRYYVMPLLTNGKTPKLIIMDRDNFRVMKKKHYIKHDATVKDLINECFYCTPYSNGDGYLTEEAQRLKLASYFSYCKAVRYGNKK